MEADRWQEIERVYHLAREQPVPLRPSFLQQCCGDDEDLRREVESLLSEADGAEEFLRDGVKQAVALVEAQQAGPDLTGQTLSHYRVMEKLGSGGMGVVYRAEDITLGRQVALKLLLDHLADHPLAAERFRREARAAAALNHPNICAVYEADQDHGRTFLVMELLEGATLKERIAGQQVSLDTMLDWAAQIAAGLAAAHARGVIHRDIKPANLFITSAGTAKILDFGVAKSLPISAALQGTLTSFNMVAGTAAYMSPEQARGEPVDARADVFSFGAVLFEMAAGRPAFDGETAAVIFDAILNRDVPELAKFNPNVPAWLERIIRKSMEKDRAKRYQSVDNLLDDLNDAASRPLERFRPWLRLWPLAAALLLTASLIGWYVARNRAAQPGTGTGTVVLADFTNTTGDSVFDGALRQGLSAQLRQSPFLSLLTDSRVGDILTLMEQPRDTRLTRKLAQEVCRRSGSTATIEGEISSAGGQYSLAVRAVNCASGELLADEHLVASGKQQVLPSLGQLASNLRRKFGESLASVQKYDAPPRDVTTESLEALQAYDVGYRAHVLQHNESAAIPLFQRAIGLDPNFAMAYASMATCYSNITEIQLASDNLQKAYELRDRVSQNEKFYIAILYEDTVTGDSDAALLAAQEATRIYPRDYSLWNTLSNIYQFLGDYPHAVDAAQESVKLSPGSGLIYATLTNAYLALNRLDEARAMAVKGSSLGANKGNRYLYQIDFLQHDTAAMEKDVAALRSHPGYEYVVLALEAGTAAYEGQFEKSRELMHRAAETAAQADQAETAGSLLALGAMRDAFAGYPGPAREEAQAGLAFSSGTATQDARCAIALALAGDFVAARKLADNLARRFPKDTITQFEYLPMIEGAILLKGSTRAQDAAKAVKILEKAARYELPQIDAAYLRGEAFLAAGQGDLAARQFRTILDHPGLEVNSNDEEMQPASALAHLGLGRAYSLQGDKGKALAAYQDFLGLWKDASPSAPMLRQAKEEYARLVKSGQP